MHSKITKFNKPWFNDNCKKAIRLRWAALHKFNLQPTKKKNLNSFKKYRAIA